MLPKQYRKPSTCLPAKLLFRHKSCKAPTFNKDLKWSEMFRVKLIDLLTLALPQVHVSEYLGDRNGDSIINLAKI